MKLCEEIMTRDPVCCLPGDSIGEAARIMGEMDIGAVPVVSDRETRRLAGIVTDRDLAIRALAKRLGPQTPVEEIMTRKLHTCREEDRLAEAVERMEKHQVRRMPVVDASGAIIGIIAQADLAMKAGAPVMVAEFMEEISHPHPPMF